MTNMTMTDGAAHASPGTPTPGDPLSDLPAQNGRAARLRRWRWPVGIVLAVMVVALAGALLARPSRGGYLAPEDAGPQGARALVQVLRDHGVDVRLESTASQIEDAMTDTGPGTTLVVARPDLLDRPSTDLLARLVTGSTGRLVLVEPDPALLTDLSLPVVAVTGDGSVVLPPDCTDLVATRAGSARLGATGFRPLTGTRGRNATAQTVAACYPGERGPGYLVLSSGPDAGTGAGRGQVILLGSGEPLTNQRLAQDGNAALSIGTIAGPVTRAGAATSPRTIQNAAVTTSSTAALTGTVVWWTPVPEPAGAGKKSVVGLIPAPVGWATGQLLIALLITMVWRSRRLGRLVTEPLPVVVHAAETTLGRATLYRRARARGRAAQVLRVATVRRIAIRCGVDRATDPTQVAAVAAARTGRPADQVLALLVGPDPLDDQALVALAHDLDALEMEVHRP